MVKKLQTAGQKAFSKVFIEQSWGNKGNVGVNYVRPYNKTRGKTPSDSVVGGE